MNEQEMIRETMRMLGKRKSARKAKAVRANLVLANAKRLANSKLLAKEMPKSDYGQK